MASVFANPAELKDAVGKPLGTSDWLEITQWSVGASAGYHGISVKATGVLIQNVIVQTVCEARLGRTRPV